MLKKKIKSHHKKKDLTLKITIWVFGFFLLAIAATILFSPKNKTVLCANSLSCIQNLSGKKEANNDGVFMGRLVTAPTLPDPTTFAMGNLKSVLGTTTPENKHIYVDLGHQKLYAYEGNNLVYNFSVSTGKWHPTPTGDFRIWIWLRYTRMAGGDPAKGTYYNLPNVPYTMYYYNSVTPKAWGYSLHGAYWHNNFGHPMSHGCVNLSVDAAGQIFTWTNPNNIVNPTDSNPGTLITIYGAPPPGETAYID